MLRDRKDLGDPLVWLAKWEDLYDQVEKEKMPEQYDAPRDFHSD